MKQKNSELPSYWILVVFGVVITACIIIYMKHFYDDLTDTTDEIVEQTIEAAEFYDEYKIIMYEFEDVQGSQVVNFIKKNLGNYSATEVAPIFVRVNTVVSGMNYSNDYVNKEHIPDIKNVSAIDYVIKPNAYFYCEVIRSANKVILGVSFTQK